MNIKVHKPEDREMKNVIVNIVGTRTSLNSLE